MTATVATESNKFSKTSIKIFWPPNSGGACY
jgi:hypothetical protein